MVKIKQRRGCSLARVPAWFSGVLRTEVDLRRGSGDFWRWGEGGRGSARRGGVRGVVDVVGDVLQRRRDAAGVNGAAVMFSGKVDSSICEVFWPLRTYEEM
jgi:hypothetical protein